MLMLSSGAYSDEGSSLPGLSPAVQRALNSQANQSGQSPQSFLPPPPPPPPAPISPDAPSSGDVDKLEKKDLGGVDAVSESDMKDDMESPNELSTERQLYCINHILNVVNHNFGGSFARSEIHGFTFLTNHREYLGFKRGGAYNVHIIADKVSAEVAMKIHPGRYTDLKNILHLGIGASLHVEDDFDGFAHTFVRRPDGDGTYHMEFLAHIDSAYAYMIPTGTLAHFLIDVVGSKTRHPCPGEDAVAEKDAKDELAAAALAP